LEASQAKRRDNADDGESAAAATNEPSRLSTRTLERGLSILDCFDLDHPYWTLSDVCKQTGLAKATAFRLLKTLENFRYVTFGPAANRYCLGPSMAKSAYLMLSHSELVRVAHPVLEALSEATTETAVVTAWLEQQALVLDVVLTPRPFRPYVRPGHIFRGPQNANVQVFLAYLPSDEVRAFITRAEKSSSSPEGGNLQKFEERLSDVRIRGLAYDLEEQTEGISAAAAPVFDASAQVRASLGVIAPAERFSAADIVNYDVHLKRAASILSRELGYQGSQNGPTP